MKLETTQKINVIASATLLSLFVIVFGAVDANAAMYSDYFTTNTDKETTSFTSWAGTNTPQACDAYNTVFYNGQCVKTNNESGGEVLGDQDKAQMSVGLIDTRCVAEQGVVELALESVKLFELKNKSTGDVAAKGGTSANFQTFSDLSDGKYVYTGRGDGGSDKVSFTIDCDPEEHPTNSSVSVSCVVTPSNPEVGEEVQWKAEADYGDGDYSYNWSGAVSGDNTTELAAYNTTGKKTGYITVRSDGESDTARCSVSVVSGNNNSGNGASKNDGYSNGNNDNTAGEGDNEASTLSRTIEEF